MPMSSSRDWLSRPTRSSNAAISSLVETAQRSDRAVCACRWPAAASNLSPDLPPFQPHHWLECAGEPACIGQDAVGSSKDPTLPLAHASRVPFVAEFQPAAMDAAEGRRAPWVVGRVSWASRGSERSLSRRRCRSSSRGRAAARHRPPGACRPRTPPGREPRDAGDEGACPTPRWSGSRPSCAPSTHQRPRPAWTSPSHCAGPPSGRAPPLPSPARTRRSGPGEVDEKPYGIGKPRVSKGASCKSMVWPQPPSRATSRSSRPAAGPYDFLASSASGLNQTVRLGDADAESKPRSSARLSRAL